METDTWVLVPSRAGWAAAWPGWGLGGWGSWGQLGPEGKEAQIMELEEQAAQDRQSTTGTEEALTATGRIQVSPAETQPPEMVKIAHTSLIWST